RRHRGGAPGAERSSLGDLDPRDHERDVGGSRGAAVVGAARGRRLQRPARGVAAGGAPDAAHGCARDGARRSPSPALSRAALSVAPVGGRCGAQGRCARLRAERGDANPCRPASVDLRRGHVAYQLRASFLPYRETVQARLDATEAGDSELVIDRISLESGATLQRGSVYLVPLLERLALPPSVRGRCNPKSTTGRLDVFTRVITDATPRSDEVAAGARGALYLEVSPQSFPVRVQAGHSLNQLRLVSGASLLSDAELVELYRTGPLLYDDDDRPVPIERATFNEGLCMGID